MPLNPLEIQKSLFSLRLGFNLGRDIFNAAAGFESLEKDLEAVY